MPRKSAKATRRTVARVTQPTVPHRPLHGPFNFLEKLLCCCVLPVRHVPAESGVEFQVIPTVHENRICLLYKVDRDNGDALVESGPRPDYLCVYVVDGEAIATIIEMKGIERRNREHGVEQILALRELLRSAISACAPGPARNLHLQGILVSPTGAQDPLPAIAAAQGRGFTIALVKSNETVDLFPYISQRLPSPTVRLTPTSTEADRRLRNVGVGLERWLMAGAEHDPRVRSQDSLRLRFLGDGSVPPVHLFANRNSASVECPVEQARLDLEACRAGLGWTERHLAISSGHATTASV